MRPGPLSALLVGALLAGCDPAPVRSGLPDTLAAVLSTVDGDLVSVVVELPRPGVEPVVRLAPGAIGIDQGQALVWRASGSAGAGSEGLLLDLGTGAERRQDFVGPVRLGAMHRDGVVVIDARGAWRLPADPTRPLARHDDDVLPGGTTMHAGPAGGFTARVEQGRLELLLPGEDATWTPILRDIDAVLGCWWYVDEGLPPWQRKEVDDRFKQVGLVRVQAGSFVQDGHLGEWRGQRALGVDDPSQVELGHLGWRGARDGGMGVAARRTEDGRLALAVRVRDDSWMPGRDLLVIRREGEELRIAVSADGHFEGPGWSAAVRQDGRYERGVEIVMDLPVELGQAVPGLLVQLVDADPGEPPTLLATAPWPAAVALGSLALVAEGPDGERPE